MHTSIMMWAFPNGKSHGTPPPYTHSSSLSTSFSSFCNISVHSIKTQGCYFFLYDATSSETPVLKLTLPAMCISDSSRVVQPIPAVTKNLLRLFVTGEPIPSYAKRTAAEWMWEFEIPWASARVLSPLRAVSGERAGEKGNCSHLTSHECSKPNLALWIWS